MSSVAPPNAIINMTAVIRDEANNYMSNLLAERGITDIMPAHGAVLFTLLQSGSRQMTEIAKRIGRKKNTVTGLIATLEKRGYCTREVDPEDHRAFLIALTPKGEALRPVLQEVARELLDQAWKGISKEDQETCMAALSRIFFNIKTN